LIGNQANLKYLLVKISSTISVYFLSITFLQISFLPDIKFISQKLPHFAKIVYALVSSYKLTSALHKAKESQ
jgi:hypothetical protein